MRKTMTSLALAAAVVAGTSITTATDADASRSGRIAGGIAAGIIAGTVLGAYAYGAPRYHAPSYAYSSGPRCYKGPRQCDWAGRSCWFNHWGERVCRGGEWRCWRPTLCD
jgi:hypothetical protein